jgi:oxygen-independent coproporphyrinogen III oxidase
MGNTAFSDAQVHPLLSQEPYQAYTYAYPHKHAYRTFAEPKALQEVWQAENRQQLFAYVHIPFCNYRCGFCNLFALGAPSAALVDAYVPALVRQMQSVANALGAHRFTRFALGGGTPSYLTAEQLRELFAQLHQHFQIDTRSIPAGVEIAPEGATRDRIRLFDEVGIDRISMGVQSFNDAELAALARPKQSEQVVAAIDTMRSHSSAEINLDLIYGTPGQTLHSFEQTLRSTLALAPDELYLYPLYVRKLTGLTKLKAKPDSQVAAVVDKLSLYQLACDLLQAEGFTQISTRQFKRPSPKNAAATPMPADYSCQTDGMIGLGAGARSYTQALHYSVDYAVARAPTSAIIAQFNQADAEYFAAAHHGFELNIDEQRRRYVMQSLLQWPGLQLANYQQRFGASAMADFSILQELVALQLARLDQGVLQLTTAGMARADAIGPSLYSDAVKQRIADYELR